MCLPKPPKGDLPRIPPPQPPPPVPIVKAPKPTDDLLAAQSKAAKLGVGALTIPVTKTTSL